MPDFYLVESNLRESFRALARGRERADLLELPGISIASPGVMFQMFNAGFLSDAASGEDELEERLDAMRAHFRSRRMEWSFWVCEDWLSRPVQRRLSRICEQRRMRLAAEMPGMVAHSLAPPRHALPPLEYRRVRCPQTLADFRELGSLCFHVPHDWFSEVFDERLMKPDCDFEAWVAYSAGVPAATAAVVRSPAAIGLYNIATAPGYRRRGIAEALTRHVCAAASHGREPLPYTLQATSNGFSMYEGMGFRSVTRILVYNSYQALR